MNIKDRNQQSSTWFRNTVVTAVMCLIPTGMASAQDFDAVQRRLLGGVKAGELSAEQAKIMMAALKKSLATKNKKDLKRPETKDGKQTDTKQRYQQAVEEIEQAVKVGKISKQDAQEKISAIKKELFGGKKDLKRPETKDGKQVDTKQRYQQAVEEIEQAVKTGKISKQDAQEKISAIKKELFGGKKDLKRPETKDGKQADTKQRYQQAVEEIEQAVKTGKISKQDAREKINQLRKELFSKGK